MRQALEEVWDAPFLCCDILEYRECFEMLDARNIALEDLARRLAGHFGEDVKTVRGTLFALSSNLGALIDSPQGQTSLAELFSTYFQKQPEQTLLPSVH